MTRIPKLREAEIQRLVGKRSFERGMEYYRSGAVFNTRRQKSALKAACTGSSKSPYRVQVSFGENDSMEAACTCPVGASGRCKHVAALLICWREKPQEFFEAESLSTLLERCSRGELIELIGRLLERQPDLEATVEDMLPTAGVPGVSPQAETYRNQVAALLHRTPETPAAAARLREQLLAIKEIGDAFAHQREFSSAAVVYQAIAAEFVERAESFDERHTELFDVLNECVDALGQCLAGRIDEADVRTAILKSLVEIYRFDLVYRATARHDVPELIVSHATNSEKRLVADWICRLLPSVKSRSDRRTFGGLLLDLEGGRLDHEAFCRLCREADRTFDLVRRLVKLGRIDEAVEEAEKADTYDLLKVADLLVRQRRADLAESLLSRRYETTSEQSLGQWLEKHRAARNDQLAVLELSEKVFRLRPEFEAYCRLRTLARELGNWNDLQPRLLAFLEQSGQMQLLVEIHLDENEVDRALELVTADGPHGGYGLELEVAKAAERSRPHEALGIYRNHVERLIGRRGRENYAEACRFLRKIRTLMNRAGAVRGWGDYVKDLRQRHGALSALLEEMATAKL